MRTSETDGSIEDNIFTSTDGVRDTNIIPLGPVTALEPNSYKISCSMYLFAVLLAWTILFRQLDQ